MIKIIPAPLAAGAGAGGGNPFSYINIIAGTITTDTSQLTTTVTWNASGTTFHAWKLTITDTASAAGSLAMQILAGSAGTLNLFSLNRLGTAIFGGSITSSGGFIASVDGNIYATNTAGVGVAFGAGADANISRVGTGILAIGTGASASTAGTLQLTTLDVRSGGSTTISTGVGSVKMSSVNAATNAAWIPIAYAGTTYFVPGYTTNSP